MNNKRNLKISRTWSFNNNVSKIFDKHVRQSIPLYDHFHKQVAKISEFYCKDQSVIYDLGCSTGNFIKELCKINKINLNLFAVDESQKMIELAKIKLKKENKKKVVFICTDIFDLKFKKSDLIVCSLMLPFFVRKKQEILIKKIYKSLNKGGAAIFLNKSISKFSHFENIFNQLYSDFKLKQNISPEDILKKTRSLRSVHTLNTIEDDFSMFKKVGFKKIDLFFKYLNFSGFIVEK